MHKSSAVNKHSHSESMKQQSSSFEQMGFIPENEEELSRHNQ
jgi:hypothetical protein